MLDQILSLQKLMASKYAVLGHTNLGLVDIPELRASMTDFDPFKETIPVSCTLRKVDCN